MMRLALLLAFFGLSSAIVAAAEPSPPETLLSKPGKLLLANELSEKPAGKGPGDWSIVDGVLKGSEREADKHGAVLRMPLKARDMVIRYDFRFDGAKTTTLSMNDAKEHVCRVVLTPKAFRVQKDDHDHAGPDKAEFLDTKSASLADGQWHTLVVEMRGPEMAATLDGKLTAFGANPMIDVDKANFGFTVSGQSVSFRNLQVWEALENPSWPEKKAELERARASTAGK